MDGTCNASGTLTVYSCSIATNKTVSLQVLAAKSTVSVSSIEVPLSALYCTSQPSTACAGGAGSPARVVSVGYMSSSCAGLSVACECNQHTLPHTEEL